MIFQISLHFKTALIWPTLRSKYNISPWPALNIGPIQALTENLIPLALGQPLISALNIGPIQALIKKINTIGPWTALHIGP